MIVRFKWNTCCVLVAIIQYVLSPVTTNAATLIKSGAVKPDSALAGGTSLKTTPPHVNDSVSSHIRVAEISGPETVLPGESARFDLTVANSSQSGITGVRLLGMLPAGFILKKGSVMLNGSNFADPVISTDDKILTFAIGDLTPLSSLSVSFMVEITAESTPGKVVNVATAISGDGERSNVAKSFITIMDARPDTKSAAVLTPVIPQEIPGTLPVKGSEATTQATDGDTGSSKLRVSRSIGRETVAPGEFVSYELTVANITSAGVPAVRLLDVLPDGFRLKKGSVEINGISVSDPAISNDGKVLTFSVGDVDHATSSKISFIIEVPEGSSPGKVVNVAMAISGDGGKSNVSKEIVTVRDDLQQTKVAANIALASPQEKPPSSPVKAADAAEPAIAVGRTVAQAVEPPAQTVIPQPSSEPTSSQSVAQTAPANEIPQTDRLVAGVVVVPEKLNPKEIIGVAETAVAGIPVKVAEVASAIGSESVKSNVVEKSATDNDKQQQTKVEANITSVASQETPLPLPVKESGLIPPASDAVKTASQDVAPLVEATAQTPQETLPTSLDNEEKLQNDDPVTGDFVVQKTQTLTELIGKAEISVLSDVDGQFVKNMAENQTLENESANKVEGTNLLESIRVGRSFNRESRAALSRTEQANAQTGQAFALLLPSVTVRANTGSETSAPSVAIDENTGKPISSETHSRTDASLSVRQPLFDLPSFMDWRRRQVVEQARGENYRVSDGDAYISSVSAYLSIVSSRLQTDMTREFESKLNELLVYVEKRAKAGAASNSDMARVRARSQATLSSRLEQESAHAAAGIEFIRLTNMVPSKVRLPVLEDIGASLLPKTLDLAVAKAIKSNPELTSLNADIEAAEIDKQAAKGRYLPRIDAEYTNSYSLHAGGSSSSQKDQRIMAVLNWNLFSGLSDYKGHAERTARHKELQYRLDDQRRRVVQSLSANYATLATTRERITSGYQELKSITTAADAMSKRMLSGNQSLLDMLDVYDRLYQVRSRLVGLHILEMSTAAQLVRLMQGTPGSSEVKAASYIK